MSHDTASFAVSPVPAPLAMAAGLTHRAADRWNDDVEASDWSVDQPMTLYWKAGLPFAHVLRGIDGVVRKFPPATDEPAPPRQVLPLSVAVVICTRDRPDELERCLASLPHQTIVDAEIIVVDNASKDSRTRAAAEAAGVRYIREDRPGLDIARNTGALAASAEIIAFTDDDVLLHPGWLAGLLSAFDAPEVGAVTGLVLPAELATPAQHQFETFWSFGRGYQRRDHRPDAVRAAVAYPAWEVGAGASMAFRRQVFDTVGLFDERLDVGQAGCSGDSEFWYRVLAAGYVCRYEPRAVAFHFHRPAHEALASQLFHYMRGHAAALMVQHERTRIAGNRWRALVVMPRWFMRRRLKPVQPRDRYLNEEISGFFSGLLFYVRRRRG